MKTRLYTLVTGLLMAACITSYGQEIIGTYEHNLDRTYSYNDLVTCSDGSVLSGIYCYNLENGQCTGMHVCKVSGEGQLIDSVTFPPAWELLGIPRTPDVFVLPNFQLDEATGDLSIKITLIDADLNVIADTTTPLALGPDLIGFMEDALFISPVGDLIVTYWTDNVYHLARIGLDGTVKATNTTTRLLPQNLTYQHTPDSTLFYQKIGVFNAAPERFYKLGGYIPENVDDPWPSVSYLFDADLNLTETLLYNYVDENHTCEMAFMMDHLAPITRGAIKDSYLLAAQIRTSDDTYATSLIKFDKDHNAIAFTNLETPTRMGGNPICTEVIDENTIYHTYNLYPNSYYLPVVGLARLNRDMDVVWNIEFPMIPNSMSYGTTLKVLANGDIAVSVVSGNYSPYCKLYIYIIRDNDPTATPETVASEKPFDIYPNPVKDRLTLRFDEGQEPESVELYDLAGSLIAKHSKAMESIDISAMPAGVYMLCVTFKDGERRLEKVIKE